MTFQFMRDLFAAPVAARAQKLAKASRFREAIDLVARSGRGDPTLERDAVGWRRSAFAPGPAPDHWPPAVADPFPGFQGVPEIEAVQLNGAVLGGAIQHHGCLLVRGLFDPGRAGKLADAVERAFDAAAAHYAGASAEETAPWFAPVVLHQGEVTNLGRQFTFEGSGVWSADCPPALARLAEGLRARGVVDAIADYMGEEPYISVGKSVLRKVPTTTGTGWHQDGSFLGAGITTVNCWLALSPCGEDAPGLELYPRRAELFATGTSGAWFEWEVSTTLVDTLLQETPSVSPVFAPGDALLFDHLFLHRTGVRPGMTRERLAIETWFFAGSSFPMKQIPLAI